MSIHQFRYLTLVAICSLELYACMESDAAVNLGSSTVRSTLEEIGQKFDCYFTIELASDVRLEEFMAKPLQIEIGSLKKDAVSRALEQSLKGFSVVERSQQPTVFHIIARSLLGNATYTMEEHVSNVTFDGTVGELLTYLNKRGAKVSAPRQFFIGVGPIRMDWSSKIKIDAENATIRDLLTNYMDLTRYYRVIWISHLDKDGTVVVRYQGLR